MTALTYCGLESCDVARGDGAAVWSAPGLASDAPRDILCRPRRAAVLLDRLVSDEEGVHERRDLATL